MVRVCLFSFRPTQLSSRVSVVLLQCHGNVRWCPSLHILGTVGSVGVANLVKSMHIQWHLFLNLRVPNSMRCGVSFYTSVINICTLVSIHWGLWLMFFFKSSCLLSCCWVLLCCAFTKANMFENLFQEFFFDPYYLQISVHVTRWWFFPVSTSSWFPLWPESTRSMMPVPFSLLGQQEC